LPLYMTRIGVALDSATSDCLIFVRQMDVKSGGILCVELNGRIVANLSMEAIGNEYVCARWAATDAPLNLGSNTLVFKATTGGGDYSRHLTLIGGYGSTVYVVASNPVSYGNESLDTAGKVLPLLPFKLTALARRVIRKRR